MKKTIGSYEETRAAVERLSQCHNAAQPARVRPTFETLEQMLARLRAEAAARALPAKHWSQNP